MTLASLPVEPLPGLAVEALVATLPRPLAAVAAPAASVPVTGGAGEELRQTVRAVLRQRGYRPTGRGKPSSEYLAQAAADGRWPAINAVVDAGNAVSLQSGLPISVVDLDRLTPPLLVRVAAAGERYVFNQGGQEIDVAGLPCLCDRDGPCANAVKDSQRSKTGAETVRVLAIVWGVDRPDVGLPARTASQLGERLAAAGAAVTPVAIAIAARTDRT